MSRLPRKCWSISAAVPDCRSGGTRTARRPRRRTASRPSDESRGPQWKPRSSRYCCSWRPPWVVVDSHFLTLARRFAPVPALVNSRGTPPPLRGGNGDRSCGSTGSESYEEVHAGKLCSCGRYGLPQPVRIAGVDSLDSHPVVIGSGSRPLLDLVWRLGRSGATLQISWRRAYELSTPASLLSEWWSA